MTFPILRFFCMWTLLALSTAGYSQSLPAGVTLGMNVSELRQVVPDLRRVARPARLAGGLVGRWSAPGVDVAGETLAPTFYFAGEELQRVEYLAATATPDRAFETLLAWARAKWGKELASASPEASYATWAREDMSVYLQLTRPPMQPSVRLVVKHVTATDASEL